jgi:CheY-like chemotaxis protein
MSGRAGFALAKILIVDDDEEMRLLWRLYLQPLGHELYEASDGLQALYMLKEHRPHIVVLDLMMPVASGDLVLGFLRSTSELKQILVLVVSAHMNVESLARQYEADAYLQKPVSVDDFRAMVNHLLTLHEQQAAS